MAVSTVDLTCAELAALLFLDERGPGPVLEEFGVTALGSAQDPAFDGGFTSLLARGIATLDPSGVSIDGGVARCLPVLAQPVESIYVLFRRADGHQLMAIVQGESNVYVLVALPVRIIRTTALVETAVPAEVAVALVAEAFGATDTPETHVVLGVGRGMSSGRERLIAVRSHPPSAGEGDAGDHAFELVDMDGSTTTAASIDELSYALRARLAVLATCN